MNFKLRLGGQLTHPQALTLVSNWGELVQVTTLQLERRRVYMLVRYVRPELTPIVEYNPKYFYHLPAISTTGGLLPKVMPRNR
ncbi:Uncharacterised protein [Serratia liquefaciens]|nr:Uncharacterised protein [Serratia liquefaciens]